MRAPGYYDADHEAFRSSFREFCAREVVPRQPGWDKAGLVDHEVWLAAGRQDSWSRPRTRPTAGSASTTCATSR